MIGDKRIAAGVRGKVYKRVVRPAMMHGLETVPLTTKKKRYTAQRMLNIDLPGRRSKRGRAQTRFTDVVKEGMRGLV